MQCLRRISVLLARQTVPSIAQVGWRGTTPPLFVTPVCAAVPKRYYRHDTRTPLPCPVQVQHQSSLAVAAPATASKALTAGKYLLGLGGAVAASQSETVAEKARLAYLIPVRLLRDVYTAASIVTGVCWLAEQQQRQKFACSVCVWWRAPAAPQVFVHDSQRQRGAAGEQQIVCGQRSMHAGYKHT
jgi:hypothetical protein